MKKVLIYLIFVILVCFQTSASIINDLKPDDKIKDLTIVASLPFYKEESSSNLVMQPFESYNDVNAYIFVYDSPRGNASNGYDLTVIFEEWRTEAQAKERFNKGFRKLWECDEEFNIRRIKKCENSGQSPQLVYSFYYQNLFIRVQPHTDYPYLTQDLFYLSFDMQKLLENVLTKILKLNEEIMPPKEDITPLKKEQTPVEIPFLEEKEILKETQPNFLSRNKHYLIIIGLLLLIFWMYKLKSFFGVISIIILGLLIFNRYTVFTQRETIIGISLWIVIYYLVSRFYIKKIKKKKINQKKT